MAPEGINLFLAGVAAAIREFLARFGEDARFAGMEVKFSDSDAIPFRRLRVKLKREIITFRKDELDAGQGSGAVAFPGQAARLAAPGQG